MRLVEAVLYPSSCTSFDGILLDNPPEGELHWIDKNSLEEILMLS